MKEEEDSRSKTSEEGFSWIETDGKEAEEGGKVPAEDEPERRPDDMEEFMSHVSESLSLQIKKEMGEEPEKEPEEKAKKPEKKVKKPLWKRILIGIGIAFGILLLLFGFLFGTKPGRKLMYYVASRYMHSQIDHVEPTPSPSPEPTPTMGLFPGDENNGQKPEGPPLPRQEDYVMTCLLFGIEEIYGARNTDSMMLAAINTRDKTVKLASIMRDSYVEIPGYRPSKLNGIYSLGSDRTQGAALLMQAMEELYHVKIDAYASVNFEAFEDIVDLLGGVTIELTRQERDYLNKENYISNPKNRNVVEGVQTLNGNQVVGYCRVRFIPTLGGAANDYGRTLRQRRVLNAIFDKYKSKGIFDLINIANTCLGYVTSNLTADQISQGLEMMVENGITSLDSARFPADGTYYDCGTTPHNGLKYTLVSTDPLENTSQMFQFIFGDTPEEAREQSSKYFEEGKTISVESKEQP